MRTAKRMSIGRGERAEARKSPARVFGDEGVIRVGEAFESANGASMRRRILFELRVAKRDASVSDEAAPLRTLYCAAAKSDAELGLRKGGDRFEFGHERRH